MKEKRWKPEDGEKFWCFDGFGYVIEDTYCKTYDDDKLEFGNCFKTKDEAETAAEKVKDLLLSFQGTTQSKNLPEWCKVGEWVAYYEDDQYKYFQITGIELNRLYGKDGKFSFVCDVEKARLRPYNTGEIPDLPFEVSYRNSNFRTIITSCEGNKIWLACSTTAISTEELMRDFTIKGNPCGVLEHLENGKWVR